MPPPSICGSQTRPCRSRRYRRSVSSLPSPLPRETPDLTRPELSADSPLWPRRKERWNLDRHRPVRGRAPVASHSRPDALLQIGNGQCRRDPGAVQRGHCGRLLHLPTRNRSRPLRSGCESAKSVRVPSKQGSRLNVANRQGISGCGVQTRTPVCHGDRGTPCFLRSGAGIRREHPDSVAFPPARRAIPCQTRLRPAHLPSRSSAGARTRPRSGVRSQ